MEQKKPMGFNQHEHNVNVWVNYPFKDQCLDDYGDFLLHSHSSFSLWCYLANGNVSEIFNGFTTVKALLLCQMVEKQSAECQADA